MGKRDIPQRRIRLRTFSVADRGKIIRQNVDFTLNGVYFGTGSVRRVTLKSVCDLNYLYYAEIQGMRYSLVGNSQLVDRGDRLPLVQGLPASRIGSIYVFFERIFDFFFDRIERNKN